MKRTPPPRLPLLMLLVPQLPAANCGLMEAREACVDSLRDGELEEAGQLIAVLAVTGGDVDRGHRHRHQQLQPHHSVVAAVERFRFVSAAVAVPSVLRFCVPQHRGGSSGTVVGHRASKAPTQREAPQPERRNSSCWCGG
eukprot:COSAG05_NODE_642_length_8135_cov_20.343703_5_plen_140_part_00